MVVIEREKKKEKGGGGVWRGVVCGLAAFL